MNAITRQEPRVTDTQLIEVMRGSLYPGAKPESVALALAYCRARDLDPMLKPVHIVPMWVKGQGKEAGAMRDVVMPGIGLYRIDAARTGGYAGKSEPEFGPMVELELSGKTYRVPEWCKVTVSRIVQGQVCQWSAREYWIENYATAGRDNDAPNQMWAKRARGQLAKCAEAQALRMAFPEAIGDQVTGEEMEGKTFAPVDMPAASGPTISGHAERAEPAPMTLLTPDHETRDAPNVAAWVRWCEAAVGKIPDAAALALWSEAMAPHFMAAEQVDAAAVARVQGSLRAQFETYQTTTSEGEYA